MLEGIERTYEWENAICYPGDYKLMQFSGLFDKDGKEIYEGDFVRFENTGYDPSEGETPWEYEAVTFIEHMWKIGDDWIGEYSSESLEVIGNIYANPDLLK